MATCKKCGWWDRICKCHDNNMTGIIVFKPMVYTDICETPLLISSKRELKRACKEHDVTAARLL